MLSPALINRDYTIGTHQYGPLHAAAELRNLPP
jgi:hypothetical protein